MILRVFLRIKVIEIAKEFVEPMHGWQVFITIAQMVLAELSRGVTQRFE